MAAGATRSGTPATDWGELYRAHVAAVCELGSQLDATQERAPVPASPAWQVRDVLAHLAGVSSDVATGRMEGAASAEWTARQVAERLALPVAELTAELASHQDAVAAFVADERRAATVWDITVHHADLREALDLEPPAEALWRPVLEAVSPFTLEPAGVALESAERAGVRAYEVFRAAFSRRSRAQVQGWGLGLGEEQLEELCVFGVREDDQPVPG